MDMEHRVSKIQ